MSTAARRRSAMIGIGALLLFVAPTSPVDAVVATTTERVSVDSGSGGGRELPAMSADGSRMYAQTTDGVYVSVRLMGGVWTHWRKTNALPVWAQDLTFVDINGTEHAFAARTKTASARSLWVCIGPFSDTTVPTCQELVVTLDGQTITGDIDGPSVATINGELRMTISYFDANRRVLMARPAVSGLIVSWQAEALQPTEIDADDVVLSDDGQTLVTTKAGVNIWRRDPTGTYKLVHSTTPSNFVSGSGPELLARSDGSLEIYYAGHVTYQSKQQDRVFSMLCQP